MGIIWVSDDEGGDVDVGQPEEFPSSSSSSSAGERGVEWLTEGKPPKRELLLV